HLATGIRVRQRIDVAQASLTLDVHGEVLLDRRLEQTEARRHGLLLRQHHEKVESRLVAESRCEVDVPAIPLPRANDDVLQRKAVRAESIARMVDARLLWRPHTGIED